MPTLFTAFDGISTVLELKSRVIPAMEAYRCCRGRGLKIAQALEAVSDFFRQHATDPRNAPLEALCPPGSVETALWRIKAPVRVYTNGNIVVLLTGLLISFTWPETAPELEACADAVGAIARAVGTKTQDDDCLQCVRKKLLSQSNPRQKETARLYRRVGGVRP